jgi:gamma-tubulin complex component 3
MSHTWVADTDSFTNGSSQDDDLTSSVYDDQTLSNLRLRLRNLSSDFNARIVVLLGDLTYQPDADLRLLGVLLSFNEFYPMVHKKRSRDREEGSVRSRTVSKQHDKGKEREQTEDTMSSMAPPPTVTESGRY